MLAVINHLHLDMPVNDFKEALETEGGPPPASQPGFRAFHFVRTADDRATVLIFWGSADAAQNGAAAFGPTWFAQHIAPHLASEQQRSVGEAIVSIVK